MSRFLIVLLLSSLSFAQGIGGKAGVGGKAGFGGGVSGGGGSAPVLDKFLLADNSAGNPGAQSFTWSGGGSTPANDFIGCEIYTSNGGGANRTYTAATAASQSLTIDSNGGAAWNEAWNGGTGHHYLFSIPNASTTTGITITPNISDYFVGVCYAFSNVATTSPLVAANTPNHVAVNNPSPWVSNASGTVTLGAGGYALLLAASTNGYGTTSITYSAPTDAAGTYTQIGSTVQGTANSGGIAVFYRAASATTSVTASGVFSGALNYDLNGVLSVYKGN